MKRKLESGAIGEALSSVAKGKQQQQQLCFVKRQLRSRFSRRRRLHMSPLFLFREASKPSHFTSEVTEQVSCDSSIASISNQKPPPAEFRYELRRIATRSYYRSEGRQCDGRQELSENSCVESCSGGNVREFLKLKGANAGKIDVEGGGEVAKSEVSSASPRFSFLENKIVRASGNENSVGGIAGSNIVFEVHQAPGEKFKNAHGNGDVSAENRAVCYVDLACSEQFSNGVDLETGEEEEEEVQNSSESFMQGLSDLEYACSDYTSSCWSYTSGSQFSEGDESHSPCFQLFSQFKQHFCRSTFALTACADDCSFPEIILLDQEDGEDEESYRLMMKRERRQVYLRDYAVEYCNTTDYGHLVIQQRLLMVHWIVEQATNKKLQTETMFLGVSLLDRFLAKGYFRNMRNLQIAGIACLTLATRIEENQPYNSVQTETFYVGKSTYSRCEVVAMEWLVQEVLNFQCFLPTLYNFLRFYLKAARANKKVDKTTQYIAVLALMGHQQLCYWPSTVAAGLVILASIAANQDASCDLITAIHARLKDKDLPECIKSLEWLVKYL